MIQFLKKYKAFIIGFFIVSIIVLGLEFYQFILIPQDDPVEVVLIFLFWWMLISLLIYKFSFIKEKKRIVYKIVGLISVLIVMILIDNSLKIPDNPVTISLLVVFWLYVVSFFTAKFFKKYGKYIYTLYTLITLYFIYVRLFTGDFESYVELKKGVAIGLFLIPIPFCVALWSFEQWKWLQSLKNAKAQAELKMLQAQINPHFFFNTLNNLYALTVKKSDKAPDVILKLSEMMRYTIYEGKNERVSIKEEIDYLENYIDLHKIRYKKDVSIEFDYNVVDDQVLIAPLLFIILVENAFKHGVEKMIDSAYVHMFLEVSKSEINFTIKNAFLDETTTPEEGIGMSNLVRRLNLLYPNSYKIITSKIDNEYEVLLKIEEV